MEKTNAKNNLVVNPLGRWTQRLTRNDDSEAKLVRAAQRGDRDAYNALMRGHESLLNGFLVKRVGATAADDVRQETWIAVWSGLPKFKRNVRFKAWLLGIAVHKCADYFRKSQNYSLNLPLEVAEEMPDLKSGFAESDRRHRMHALLDTLPEEQRRVLELYYEGDLTLAEVATVLERNLNTVKAQFYRAHAQLKQSLETENEGESLRLW